MNFFASDIHEGQMPNLRPLFVGAAVFAFATSAALAQMTPEDLKAQIDSRSGNLSGFQDLLDDPDPQRSLAAVESMLISGDSNLERMALTFGLTSPDAAIRATTLEHHFAKLPAVAISFDATELSEDEMGNYIKVLNGIGGSIGPNKMGSFNYQPAAYDEKMGCYPHASNERLCAMRLGRSFVSIHFFASNAMDGRWVNFEADETGLLKGGANFDFRGASAGQLPLTIRLLN